jgi:hypothetical protein
MRTWTLLSLTWRTASRTTTTGSSRTKASSRTAYPAPGSSRTKTDASFTPSRTFSCKPVEALHEEPVLLQRTSPREPQARYGNPTTRTPGEAPPGHTPHGHQDPNHTRNDRSKGSSPQGKSVQARNALRHPTVGTRPTAAKFVDPPERLFQRSS